MEVEFRVTNLCQLNCEHCYIDAGRHQGSKIIWDKEIIDRVVDFTEGLVELISSRDKTGKVMLKFSGGEPMLLGAKMLSYFSDRISSKLKFTVLGIVSNFLSYNKDIGKIAKEYNWIVFASYDPDIRFKEKRYLESVFERKVKEALDDGLDVILSVVMTRSLFKFDILNYALNLGVSTLYLAPYVSTGRGFFAGRYLRPSREEVVEFVKLLYRMRGTQNIKLLPFDDIEEAYRSLRMIGYGSIECWSECFNDFGINPDLTVTSLGMCYEKGCFYGKIGKDVRESVFNIVNSPDRLNFMKYKLFGNEQCTGCKFYSFCRGGCLSYEKHEFSSECRGLFSLLEFLSESFT
ncbi:MAG: radical SAM protein [Nitrososphaeria archaeon]